MVASARVAVCACLVWTPMHQSAAQASQPVWRDRTGWPAARQDHAMVYDSARHVHVLFGGRAGNASLADTWEWDGSAWTLAAVTGPGPRLPHAMAYDSARDVTVLYGGWAGTGAVDDTWEWNGTAWAAWEPPNDVLRPYAMHSQAMAYDASRRVTVLFGGSTSDSRTWTWDGSRWTSWN